MDKYNIKVNLTLDTTILQRATQQIDKTIKLI